MSGRKVLPEEMLAPSRFFARYQPQRYRAEVSGDWALVSLSGDGNDPQPHSVKCVREGGRWRVVMELPPSQAIEKRLERPGEREAKRTNVKAHDAGAAALLDVLLRDRSRKDRFDPSSRLLGLLARYRISLTIKCVRVEHRRSPKESAC